ncbi:hypothetical protein R84981_002798 [Carnimonas sp. R-84981]
MSELVRVKQSQLVSIFCAERVTPSSTEMVLHIADVTLPEIAIELWGGNPGSQHLCGYAVLKLHSIDSTEEGFKRGVYLLDRLLEGSYQPPCPVAVVSGVLWNRREALLSAGETLPSLYQLNQGFRQSSPQESHGLNPHES